ncbi:hypothetical protein [Brevibacillus reuszeri]|uniref:hypothetical protein n=1 Tax=Brevibacillus reuszeri TaxID=54915 RepID=UPI003D1B4178
MGLFDSLKEAGKKALDQHIQNTNELQKRVDREKEYLKYHSDSQLREMVNNRSFSQEKQYAAAQLLRDRDR